MHSQVPEALSCPQPSEPDLINVISLSPINRQNWFGCLETWKLVPPVDSATQSAPTTLASRVTPVGLSFSASVSVLVGIDPGRTHFLSADLTNPRGLHCPFLWDAGCDFLLFSASAGDPL